MSAPAIDLAALRRAYARAAQGYADAAVLAREVEGRMLERLQYVKLEPSRILDAGCGAGDGARRLAERYPHAQVVGLDFAYPMLRAAAGREAWLRRVFQRPRIDRLCADFAKLPLPAACVDLAWSNLSLDCAGDPQPVMKELQQALRVGGLLMFSCYGPDTLKELRQAFAAHDSAPHVHAFTDMHDLGDMLAACGFSSPVMDMEVITLTYAEIETLFSDLRASGQENVGAGRRRGLTGKGVMTAMRAEYERLRRGGRLPASFEIVYGHAWKPEPRRTADGHAIIRMPAPRAKGA